MPKKNQGRNASWWSRLVKLFSGHQHDFIYFDQSGDPLSENPDSEACFRGCETCGQIEIIPQGFNDDASFDNFLSMREIGTPSAERRIARFLEGTISSNSGEGR